ncbi:MAG: hypothetical protein ABMA64_22935, partial [Myxococcota bacterium]
RWWSTTVHDATVSLCLPGAPRVAGDAEAGSFGVVDLVVGTDAGEVRAMLLASTSGVFPMESNFPDATSGDVLVQSDAGDGLRWWFTTRAVEGPTRGLTARIPDAYGEDVLCSAHADLGPGVDEAAVWAALSAVCRSMRLDGPTGGPCTAE